jgi:hypothetical protein
MTLPMPLPGPKDNPNRKLDEELRPPLQGVFTFKKADIVSFFEDYAARFRRALADPPEIDVEGSANAFANYFVESSPAGVQGSKNDAELRKMIPHGLEFYREIGTTSMTIAALDILPIDALHWMARVHWDSKYQRKDGSKHEIAFDVVYFMTTLSGASKIFAYVTGDEKKALKEHGLL